MRDSRDVTKTEIRLMYIKYGGKAHKLRNRDGH